MKKNYFQNVFKINADSHFHYGFNCGIKLRIFFHILWNVIKKITTLNKEIEYHFEKYLHIYKTYFPSSLSELKGLSLGTQLEIEKLIFIQMFLSDIFHQQCTITASTDPATKDNQTFLTQNWDLDTSNPYFYLLRYFFSRILFKSSIKTTYSYIFIGIPVLYEYPLLNEAGLGWGGAGTFLTENKSRGIDEGRGISPYILVRESMMQCCTVSEVAALWKNSTRSSCRNGQFYRNWDYDTYAWCDKNGGILMIEQTHSDIATVFNKHSNSDNNYTGILWHTNHHIWLNPYHTGSIIPSENRQGNNSQLRLERAHELLVMQYGHISLDGCKNITRDHLKGTIEQYPDASDICRHADNNVSYATAIAWIIQPKS